jgi:hypothetical protein
MWTINPVNLRSGCEEGDAYWESFLKVPGDELSSASKHPFGGAHDVCFLIGRGLEEWVENNLGDGRSDVRIQYQTSLLLPSSSESSSTLKGTQDANFSKGAGKTVTTS